MTTEEETLEIYKQMLAEDRVWRDRLMRLLAMEIGAKMRSPVSGTSSSQRNNVRANAEWAYEQATGLEL